MKKETAINTINDFPKEFNLEDLMERLVFIDKIEKGLSEAKKGKGISHEKLKEKFREKWSK
jgi:predicted transcriptional regulator